MKSVNIIEIKIMELESIKEDIKEIKTRVDNNKSIVAAKSHDDMIDLQAPTTSRTTDVISYKAMAEKNLRPLKWTQQVLAIKDIDGTDEDENKLI